MCTKTRETRKLLLKSGVLLLLRQEGGVGRYDGTAAALAPSPPAPAAVRFASSDCDAAVGAGAARGALAAGGRWGEVRRTGRAAHASAGFALSQFYARHLRRRR